LSLDISSTHPPPPVSNLFPYTTLFRSGLERVGEAVRWVGREHHGAEARRGAAASGRRRHACLAHASLARVEDRAGSQAWRRRPRSEEHTSELQSRFDLVCRLLLEKKKL